jgi:hypothetical protein
MAENSLGLQFHRLTAAERRNRIFFMDDGYEPSGFPVAGCMVAKAVTRTKFTVKIRDGADYGKRTGA